MSRVHDVLNREQMVDCPECGGSGVVEHEIYRRQGFNRDVGYIDTEMGECEMCEGRGEVVKPCCGCGEALYLSDGDETYCIDCRNEGVDQ